MRHKETPAPPFDLAKKQRQGYLVVALVMPPRKRAFSDDKSLNDDSTRIYIYMSPAK